MSRCKYCDAENPEDARFCGSCGQTGQNAPRTELGKPLEVDASHDANRERIASDEGQKAAQGDIVLSFDQAHNAPASAHVPTLQGTPQIGHLPTVQGIPTTPRPPHQHPRHLTLRMLQHQHLTHQPIPQPRHLMPRMLHLT